MDDMFDMFNDSSSDEEWLSSRRRWRMHLEQQQGPRRQNTWGGSRQGRRPNIERSRGDFHEILMQDYFVENPVYTDQQFRRRFRMRRQLFNRIKEELLTNHAAVWGQKTDACGKVGFSVEQKMTACLRVLAYGGAADRVDEYICMGESTTLKYLHLFCEAIISSFSPFYLRKPTEDDFRYLLALHSSRGWPGKLGSLDVMHWEWKNCPIAWAGMYQLGVFFFLVCFCLLINYFYFFTNNNCLQCFSQQQQQAKKKNLPLLLKRSLTPDCGSGIAFLGRLVGTMTLIFLIEVHC
jgi:hypothetical protein